MGCTLQNPLAPHCSFFRNVDSRQGVAVDLPATTPGRGKGSGGQPLPIAELRARAVLVDMEEGVVNSILKASSNLLLLLPCCVCGSRQMVAGGSAAAAAAAAGAVEATLKPNAHLFGLAAGPPGGAL